MTTTPGSAGVLLERDTVPPYVRVVPAAAKLPEDQVVPTVVDPRFPLNSVVLLPDTASVTPEPLRAGGADSPAVRATLAEWAPGRMRVTLRGSDAPRVPPGRRELVSRLARHGGRHGRRRCTAGDHTLLTRGAAAGRPRGERSLRVGRVRSAASW